MFAKLVNNPGSTSANCISDVVKVFTGETNLANLSSNIVSGDSYILSTDAAGWTLHDAAASANSQVIKAICNDGVNYKYVRIDWGENNNGWSALGFRCYEGWNAGTHSGTNNFGGSSSSAWLTYAGPDIANGGVMFLASTVRFLTFFFYQAGAFQFGFYSLPFTCDFTANDGWWSTSYPPWMFTGWTKWNNVSSFHAVPRVKGTSGDLTAQAGARINIFGEHLGNYSSAYPIYTGLDSDGTTVVHFLVRNYLFHFNQRAAYLGQWDNPCFASTGSYGASGDYVTYNGVQYFVVKLNSSPTGGSDIQSILIPMR